MNITKWELFLEGARFYEGNDDLRAEKFYWHAHEAALLETQPESAASALVLDHLEHFLFSKGRILEAESCDNRARKILRAYGSAGTHAV